MPRKSSRRRSKVRKRKSSPPRRRSKTRARRYGRTEREYGVATYTVHHPPSQPSSIPDITPLITDVSRMEQKFESNTILHFQSRRGTLLAEYDRIMNNLNSASASEDAERLKVSVNTLIDIIDVYLSILELSKEIVAMIEPLLVIFTDVHITDVGIQNVVETFILPCLTLMQSISSFMSTIENAETSEELKEPLKGFRNETRRLRDDELSRVLNVLMDEQESRRDKLRFDLSVSNAQPQKMQLIKQLEQNIAFLHSFPGHKVPTTQSTHSIEVPV